MRRLRSVDTNPMTTRTLTTRTRTWFPQLWALAVLFHLFGNNSGLRDPGRLVFYVELAMALGATVVWFWPHRARLMGAVAALQLWDLWLDAPVIGNHTVLLGLVNLSLVIALAVERASGKHWLDLFAPAGRVVLLASYAFIAFSKLNSGFFDPAESCAVVFGDEVVRWVGVSIGWGPLQNAVIWATVVAELAVPLLLWRRPRLGVPFALALHFLFALDPVGHVYDFSSALFPLFLLFTPADFDPWFEERWRPVRPRLAGLGLAMIVAFLVLAAFDMRASLAGYPLWLFYAIVLLGSAIAYGARWVEKPVALRPHPAFGFVLALVLLNGVSPYFELKTTFGFNMYSNLRTEAGQSNHFVITRTLPLRDGQEHVVEIVDSSDEALRGYREQRLGLTYQSLRAYLADHPEVSLRYRLGGQEYLVERAADVPELVAAPGVLVQKLGAYRAIDLEGENGCLRWWRPAL
jgi:hypothetical protein